MTSTPDEFVRLRTSDCMDEQRHASQMELSVSEWRMILENNPEMAFWVAQNKTVPIEILHDLATHKDPNVRSMVAIKGKLPLGLMRILARDEDSGVRRCISGHKKATLEVLELLVDDEWEEVAERAKKRIRDKAYRD